MNNLSKYLNYGYTNRPSKYLSKVFPDRLILSLFVDRYYSEEITSEEKVNTHKVPEVNSNNNFIKELKLVCSNYKLEMKITIAVFGSIASEETVNYSDFDGILIYDEKEFISNGEIKKLKNLIEEINLISHLQDVLQHHRIIVVGKKELIKNRDDITYHLLKESKLVYGLNEIKISNQSKADYRNSLTKLSSSIQNKLNQGQLWKNQYFFKNLLSELLLLPCSYLQNHHQKYISKKDSFELIKSHLQPNELSVINQLENMRANWIQKGIRKSELSKNTIARLKKNSLTQTKFIAVLSEIKSDLQLLLTRLKPND
jgi:predicted nucleotidyltransferase